MHKRKVKADSLRSVCCWSRIRFAQSVEKNICLKQREEELPGKERARAGQAGTGRANGGSGRVREKASTGPGNTQ